MSQGLCWVPLPPTDMRARAHVYTHIRSFRIPCEHVIQVRCCLPVTTTSPEVTDPASFRDLLFPSSVCPQGSGRDDSAPASPRCGKSEPISGTFLGGPGNRHLSQVVVQGQESQLELLAALYRLYHAQGRAPYRGHQPRIKGLPEAGRGMSWQQQWVSPDPAVPEAIPALHLSVKARPIASPWAGVSFN